MADVPAKISTTQAVRQFAKHGIAISAQTVRRMCANGDLTAVQVGTRYKIDPASVERIATIPPTATNHSH